VPVASDAYFSSVVRRLAAAGITATELSLHLPSLDEVFFTLTGRTVDAEQATAEPAAPAGDEPVSDPDPTDRKAMAHQ
jgi:oleandomycin transport system ATP-binding protein